MHYTFSMLAYLDADKINMSSHNPCKGDHVITCLKTVYAT